jgi:hypothetical protein
LKAPAVEPESYVPSPKLPDALMLAVDVPVMVVLLKYKEQVPFAIIVNAK